MQRVNTQNEKDVEEVPLALTVFSLLGRIPTSESKALLRPFSGAPNKGRRAPSPDRSSPERFEPLSFLVLRGSVLVYESS